jgi:acyl phosphate:glycerol-3-phosphate acyltransferase
MMAFYFIISYFIGTIMFGYLLTKYVYHRDILDEGSGNVGARNAGGLYGNKAFVLVFIADALKGAAVVALGLYLNYPDYVQLLGLGAALIGHIKPVTLRFRGGKGISTFIGGVIAFEPLVIIPIILAFLVTYPYTRSFTISGLSSFLFIPIFILCSNYTLMVTLIMSLLVIIIFLAHSKNIKERLLWKKALK